MIRIAILGGSGYTARELVRILLRHPQAEIVAVCSRQEGTPLLSELHPCLTGRIDIRLETLDPDRLKAKGVQCVFGCLPHGVSMSTMPALLERGMRVIDLSADYRLRRPDVYEKWYRETHHDPARLAEAAYGLPELYAAKIRTAQLVANPGCYPQTAILGLAPLVAENLIDRKNIIIDSKSGVSGAGRTPKLTTLFTECNESVAAYSVGDHRHTPEIEQALSDLAGEEVPVIFTPHLMPMDRGIFSTIYAVPRRTLSQAQVMELFRSYYARAPFVRVVDHLPATKDTALSNFLDVTVRIVRDRLVILAAEDNLVRGASGVAVQNLNLMYALDEKTGLD